MDLETPSKVARWNVLRVKAGGVSEVVLLSGQWLRLTTHFYRRTFLCAEGEDCPMCVFQAARCLWYLPCLIRPGRWLGVLELGAAASADLEQRSKFSGGGLFPGLQVRVSRRAAKKAVVCEPVSSEETVAEVPLHVWVSGLFRVFGFGALRPGETIDEYGARSRDAIRRRAEHIARSYEASVGGRVKGRGECQERV